MKKRKTGISYFKCSICNKQIPLPRKMMKQRPKNHIKTMWCPFCLRITDFIEEGVRSWY